MRNGPKVDNQHDVMCQGESFLPRDRRLLMAELPIPPSFIKMPLLKRTGLDCISAPQGAPRRGEEKTQVWGASCRRPERFLLFLPLRCWGEGGRESPAPRRLPSSFPFFHSQESRSTVYVGLVARVPCVHFNLEVKSLG